MNHNLDFPRRGWMGRWVGGWLDGAIADRLDRLERQVQTYQQENSLLQQQLGADRAQLQNLTEQVLGLEQWVKVALEPKEKDKHLAEVDRQLSRVWQYYQDAKVQFEKINRQIQQQKATSEETTQKFRKQITKTNSLRRSEIRDLKQQLDQVAFSLHGTRQVQEPVPQEIETIA